MAAVKFLTGSYASYAALAEKDAGTLYFLTDTKQLYKGADLYCKSFETVSTLPTSGAEGVLYVVSNTKKLYTWNGSSFVEALDAFVQIDASVSETGANAVSGKAVYDFVASEIAALTGGSSNAFVTSIVTDNENLGSLTVTKGTESNTVAVKLDGLAKTPQYDADTRKFTFPVVNGTDVVVELGKDMVVKKGEYDTENQEIVLTLTDDTTVKIPAGDLVDIYTASADTTGAAQITIANNKVKAAVLVDNTTIKVENGVLKADFSTLALASTVEALTTRVAANETAISNLTTNVNSELDAIKGRVSTNETDIATIKSDYAKTADVESGYYNKTTIDTKVSALNDSIAAVQTNLTNALTWVAIEG